MLQDFEQRDDLIFKTAGLKREDREQVAEIQGISDSGWDHSGHRGSREKGARLWTNCESRVKRIS